jgi:predicted RNA-binding Zn-ribbon protein involved in translation (DUF1610 family)
LPYLEIVAESYDRGKNVMEIVIILFVLVGGSIAFSAWKSKKSPENTPSADSHTDIGTVSSYRTCMSCGHQGEMKTWLSNYTAPKLIAVTGFLLGYIPGLIFLAIYWGKYKCPQCGAVGKNQQIKNDQ